MTDELSVPHPFRTIPSRPVLFHHMSITPAYKIPTETPYAFVGEGFLSNAECDGIIRRMMQEDPYPFPGCGAITRELQSPLGLDLAPLVEFANAANQLSFHYDLNDNPEAWLQTYKIGGSYRIHADHAPGQSRKLTTVALLTDPEKYGGGILRLIPWPEFEEIPRTRGTCVTFPSWTLHEVSEVTWGERQTLNLGHYGPPFK